MQRAPAEQDDSVFDDIRPARLWRVMLPMFLAGFALIALIVLVLLSFSPIGLDEPGQVSIISNIFVIICALCPLVICALPLYFVVIMGVYGVNMAEKSGRKSLRGLRGRSRKMADRTGSATDKINKRSIKWGTRLTYIGEFFSQPKDEDADQPVDPPKEKPKKK